MRYRTHALILAAFALTLGGLAAQTRCGFIDRDGKYISSPDFSWVGQAFSGDLAPGRTADGMFAFVDRSGKKVLSGKFDTLWFGFTAGLAPVPSGGKWGYIDTTGKWVIDPQFDLAMNFADGLAPVLVAGRWGYVDQKGKFVVNPQYDGCDEFYAGYANSATPPNRGPTPNRARMRTTSAARAVPSRPSIWEPPEPPGLCSRRWIYGRILKGE